MGTLVSSSAYRCPSVASQQPQPGHAGINDYLVRPEAELERPLLHRGLTGDKLGCPLSYKNASLSTHPCALDWR